MAKSPDKTPVEAFLEQYWKDKDADNVHALNAYLSAFPGAEATISEEYVRLEGGDALSVSPCSASGRQDHLGPYKLEEEIGRGGQGVVYRATDTRIDRTVALKVLRGLGPGAEDLLIRFKREAAAAGKLDHPGICAVYDAEVEGGIPYIAMRYVEGETLARRITNTRQEQEAGDHVSTVVALEEIDFDEDDGTEVDPTPTPSTAQDRSEVMRAVRLVEKAARALHAVHEAGIIHRDIKPGNVMITTAGEPVLMDFGLARDEDSDLQTLTRSGDLFGTPAYMSPEQLTAQRIRLDRRTDVWSLGVVLYECVTLQRPFDAPTRETLYKQILGKEPLDPRKVNPSISRDLSTVIQTALDKDMDRRYQTAEMLAEDLLALRKHVPIKARPVSAIGRVVRWGQREPIKAALASSLLIALLGAAALAGHMLSTRHEVRAGKEALLRRDAEARIDRAFEHLLNGQRTEARRVLDGIVGSDQRNIFALTGRALTEFRLNRRPTRTQAMAALGCLGGDPSPLEHAGELAWVKAWFMRQAGDDQGATLLEDANRGFKPALRHFLEGLEHWPMARAGHRLHATQAAQRFTAAIERSSRQRLVFHFFRLRALSKAGDDDKLADAIDAITGIWPTPAAWRCVGTSFQRGSDKRGEALQHALDLDPDDPLSLLSMGSHFLMKTRMREAISCFEKARRLDPGGDATVSLGRAYTLAGKLDEAVRELEQAASTRPDHAGLHLHLGRALMESGEYARAIEVLDYAQTLRPLPDARAWKGRALEWSGETEEALAVLEQARHEYPDHRLIRGTLAMLLASRGRVDEAQKEIDDLLRNDPKHVNTLNHGAWFYAYPGRSLGEGTGARAVELAKRARDISHGWLTLNTLGAALLKNGEYDEALEILLESHDLRGESGCLPSPFDAALIAMTYWRRRMPQDAREWLGRAERFLNSCPGDGEAQHVVQIAKNMVNGK